MGSAAVVTRRDIVLKTIARVFPDDDGAAVLARLEAYGTEPHETDVDRVHLAVLKLCEEDGASEPSGYVARAKQDSRDVIAWAEFPNQTAFGPTDDPAKSADLRKRDDEQYRAWIAKMG